MVAPNAGVALRSGASRAISMLSVCLVNPVPTCPAKVNPSGPYTPTISEPIWSVRTPSPGFQPPITNSWRWMFLIFRQLDERAGLIPGRQPLCHDAFERVLPGDGLDVGAWNSDERGRGLPA